MARVKVVPTEAGGWVVLKVEVVLADAAEEEADLLEEMVIQADEAVPETGLAVAEEPLQHPLPETLALLHVRPLPFHCFQSAAQLEDRPKIAVP